MNKHNLTFILEAMENKVKRRSFSNKTGVSSKYLAGLAILGIEQDDVIVAKSSA